MFPGLIWIQRISVVIFCIQWQLATNLYVEWVDGPFVYFVDGVGMTVYVVDETKINVECGILWMQLELM